MKKNIAITLNIHEVKQYDPKAVEDEIYAFWEQGGFLKPEYNLQKNKEDRFTIILPPPNANARLHLGHASGYSNQDLMGRYNRMLGKETLLLPGKDHAGIQTEVVFEKELAKKGIKKRELGREEFYKQCYEFSIMNAALARSQEQKLGLSADYSRELFTLDPRIEKTVMETFVEMYHKGYLYRGKRIINWCVRCQTALADIDTEAKNEDGKLYYITYGPFTIATTRPETKMADTAIAVNPRDPRYKKYIDTQVEIQSVEGIYSLPVIGDESVDMEFGTGVLKVTPGHSMEDFAIGQRHNLPIKTVIDFYGKMTKATGVYANMKVLEAREAVVNNLKALGLLQKTEDINHNIKVCERCKSTIEPLISYQWFVKLDDLKRKAIQSVSENNIHFHPKRQEKNFIRWLEIPEDWCISRHLWWGYQIPAWYCGGKTQTVDDNGNVVEIYGKNGCGEVIVSQTIPTVCPKCQGTTLIQDEDILDTWFSSGQWPFATLLARQEDFDRYFPTQVMETGRDIIFFWVARMVMMSLYKYGTEPFSDVYLHGIVLDKEGKKQSKSKNNGIDPMDMIEKYGADALRMSFIAGNGADQDYKLYEEKVRGFRNFINKIWNASRFILLQIESLENKELTFETSSFQALRKEDHHVDELMTGHEAHIEKINKLLKAFKLGQAGEEVFNYFWHRFCDIDIETMKRQIAEAKDEQTKTLYVSLVVQVLIDELQLLHPFTPFITEYLWQIFKQYHFSITQSESIMYSNYPKISGI